MTFMKILFVREKRSYPYEELPSLRKFKLIIDFKLNGFCETSILMIWKEAIQNKSIASYSIRTKVMVPYKRRKRVYSRDAKALEWLSCVIGRCLEKVLFFSLLWAVSKCKPVVQFTQVVVYG